VSAVPLSSLEIASGLPLGAGTAAPARVCRERAAGAGLLRRALEDELLEHLARGPCVVAFSGGRDSSVLLAIADHVARREGLARPVAVSVVAHGAPASREDEAQAAVIAHLRLPEHERIDVGRGELDSLGERSLARLRHHGLLYASNQGISATVLERSRGATVIDGVGGDELLGGWHARAAMQVLTRRHRPAAADARAIASALLPRPLRRARLATRPGLAQHVPGWLTDRARAQIAALLAAEVADEPRAWDTRIRWKARRRFIELNSDATARLAAQAGATAARPFLAERVIDALARAGGRGGLGSRPQIIRALAADLLPEAIVNRRAKATFDEVFWTQTSQAAAERVLASGRTAAAEHVDLERLAAVWRSPRPPGVSQLLLQASILEAEQQRQISP
jgi:asparagine synthase (glutamine-hydrolysing)